MTDRDDDKIECDETKGGWRITEWKSLTIGG